MKSNEPEKKTVLSDSQERRALRRMARAQVGVLVALNPQLEERRKWLTKRQFLHLLKLPKQDRTSLAEQMLLSEQLETKLATSETPTTESSDGTKS